MSFKIDNVEVSTADVAIYSMMVFGHLLAVLEQESPKLKNAILNKMADASKEFEAEGRKGIAALMRETANGLRTPGADQ